jgi:hypothetical protein
MPDYGLRPKLNQSSLAVGQLALVVHDLTWLHLLLV